MTMTDAREVLSALIDRENVDPDVLAAVLEDAAHRRLLVDFVRLRAALHEPATRRPHVAPVPRPRRRPWRAAAAALCCLALGAAVGAWTTDGDTTDAIPPEPTRVVTLSPVAPAPAIQ